MRTVRSSPRVFAPLPDVSNLFSLPESQGRDSRSQEVKLVTIAVAGLAGQAPKRIA